MPMTLQQAYTQAQTFLQGLGIDERIQLVEYLLADVAILATSAGRLDKPDLTSDFCLSAMAQTAREHVAEWVTKNGEIPPLPQEQAAVAR